ncbi:PP2C family protein-serine/threonine phosphatase [Kitasatospora phosalacinea]|uniref:PP2C family protein-serine/threonine phosphatase n=1 Tax=Kitasatospora phosalacinea TaxID=2065 RepID=UPI000AF0F2A3|nr:PP2C family protein-serine/threonine phosphatase [Kitasatospora phosalacinea]
MSARGGRAAGEPGGAPIDSLPEDGDGAATPVARAAALVGAVLLYGLVVGLQYGTDGWHLPSVLVAVPAVAALTFGPPVIVGAAVVAVVTRWVFALSDPGRTGAAVGTTAVILGIAALGCFVVRRRERAAARLVSIATVAETAQRAVLRPVPAAVGPYAIAAGYRAAARDARIGGDLYAVADTPSGLRTLIGDVRGKGLDAVATAAVVLGAFHEAVLDAPSLGALAGRLDTSLRRFLTDDPESFATVFLLEAASDGTVRGLSCGHPAPLLLHGSTVSELSVPPGLPLGLRNEAGAPAGVPPEASAEASGEARVTHLEPGDTLLLYTDGLAEARDRSGAFYPLPARLAACAGLPPRALVDRLQQDAHAFAGGTDDDAALLALTWHLRPPAD